MKHSITKGYLLFVLIVTILFFGGDAVADKVYDHRVPERDKVYDHRDPQRKNTVVKVMPTYIVSWYKPTKIPADLEDWLNTRMKGYGLVGVAKDDSSGRYNSFFKKLLQGRSWNYNVKIVPEASIEKALKSARSKNMTLIAVTSEHHGPRGLMYICFFRKS